MSLPSDRDAVPVPGLTGAELLRYFSMQASDLVDEKIREREERRAKKAAVALTLLSIIGVSGTITLVNYMITNQVQDRFEKSEERLASTNKAMQTDIASLLQKQQELIDLKLSSAAELTSKTLDQQGEFLKQQETRVQALGPELDTRVRTETTQAMGAQVNNLRSDLRTEVDYQRLSNFALGLDIKTGFSRTERDAVLELLQRLKGTEIVARSDFEEVLRKIVSSFHAADQGEQIDEIDDILGEVMLDSPAIATVLVQHYGERVIGSRHHPSEISPLIARFQRYLSRSERNGDPEQEIFWELLLDIKRTGAERFTVNREAMEALKYLEDDDKRFFFITLVRYSFPPLWVEKRTYESTEIARVCRVFRNAYSQDLQVIFATIPNGKDDLENRFLPALQRGKVDEETAQEMTGFIMELTGEPDEGPKG